MSSPNVESPTGKKQGLKKRLLRFFSRSEGNIKEKARSRSEGDKSPVRENHVEKKTRSSWSEKRGKKERNEVQEGAQSLPWLRHPRSEDSGLRRSSRDSKARSFSYSDLEVPSSNLLQRFGSLTWRKKRSSMLEYHDVSSNASSHSQSHWSMGRLDRPAVGSDLDLKNRRPISCIVESPYSEFTSKGSAQFSKSQYGGQKALEVSTSFDYLLNDDEDYSPSYPSPKGKTNQLQLPLTFLEKLEVEEEDDPLPCWAESILKDYLTPEHSTPDSQLCPLYDENHSLEVLEQDEKHFHYRSPIHHLMSSKEKALEQSSKRQIAIKVDLVSNECITPIHNRSTCIEIQKQNSHCKSQPSLNSSGQIAMSDEPTGNQILLYTSMLSEDVAQSVFSQNLPLDGEQKNTSKFEVIKHLHSPTKNTKQKETTKHNSSNRNSELWETVQSQGHLDTFNDKEHNVTKQINCDIRATHNLPELHTTMQENIKGRSSPSTPKIKYQVIITMTKEEKERGQVPALAKELVKGDELVGQDLNLSPSLESEACGYHGAGATEVIAQSLSETSEQPEQGTALNEEIPNKRRVSKSCEGEHLERSLSLEVDDNSSSTNSGSEQVAELDSSNMEKRDELKKDNSNFPKRAQGFRMPETQKYSDTSKWSVKKDIHQPNMTISDTSIPSQAYVGHVKNLQKVFEDISSKDVVSPHVQPVKSKQGSHRQKDHVSEQETSVAGLHGPVFSQIFNPLKKDHLDKKSEATISVIDSSGKLHPCIITENYMDTSDNNLEINDRFGKDFTEMQLNNSYYKTKETFQKHPKHTLQDLQLSPRTPTPPPQMIKNNVSISLGSPKGWKNENAVIRPTKHFFGQRFENPRDTFPIPSHSSNFNEFQQKHEQIKQNRIKNALREVKKKPHTIGKMNEEQRIEHSTTLATNLLGNGSPTVSSNKKLDTSRNYRDITLVKNEIQAEYQAHEDSGQTDQGKNKVTTTHLESGNKEDLPEESETSSKQLFGFSNNMFPKRSQKNQSPHRSDVRVKKHIYTQEDLEGSHSSKVVSKITKDIVVNGTEITYGAGNKTTTHTVVQSKYPALIIKKVISKVDLDGDQLNQNSRKSEMKVPSEKGKSSVYQNLEMKQHELVHGTDSRTFEVKSPDLEADQHLKGIEKTLSTAFEDKPLSLINETMRCHSKESINATKQKPNTEIEKDISRGQNINYKLNQEIGGMIKDDSSMVKNKNIENISKALLKSTVAESIEKSIDHPTTDVISAHKKQVGNKNALVENYAVPEVVTIASSLDPTNETLNGNDFAKDQIEDIKTVENKNALVENYAVPEVVTIASSLDPTSETLNGNDFAKDHIEDIKTQSLDTNNHSEELLVLLTSAKHSCDQGDYNVEDLINQSENYLAASKRDVILHNDLLNESHTNEPLPHTNKIPSEIIKSTDIMDSIEEKSFVHSNIKSDYTIKQEYTMLPIESQEACVHNIHFDNKGHDLDDQMNLDQNNASGLKRDEVLKENPTAFGIQNSGTIIESEDVIEGEKREVEKNVSDNNKQNGQKAIVYPSAEFRDQLPRNPNEEYLGEKFSDSEDSESKVDNKDNEDSKEEIDNEDRDAGNLTKRVGESVLGKLGLMEKDQKPVQKKNQVDDLMIVVPINNVHGVTVNETWNQGINASMDQSLSNEVYLETYADGIEFIHMNEKRGVDSSNWASALDQAMYEHEKEKSKEILDLEVVNGRPKEFCHKNEDKMDIPMHMNLSANDVLAELSEEIDHHRTEAQEDGQHKDVIHHEEDVLDSAAETRTPPNYDLNELNQTNNQLSETMNITFIQKDHPHDNSNSELIQNLTRGTDERLVTLQDKEQNRSILTGLQTNDNQRYLHEYHTETSSLRIQLKPSEPLGTTSAPSQGVMEQSQIWLPEFKLKDSKESLNYSEETSNSIIAHIKPSEPLDVQIPCSEDMVKMSNICSLTSHGVEGQSIRLPELKSIDIQENVDEHHTETSNSIKAALTLESPEVQISNLKDTKTSNFIISDASQSVEAQGNLPLPELNTIDTQENIDDHKTESSNSINSTLSSSDSPEVKILYLRDTETLNDTSTKASQGVDGQSPLPKSKTIDNIENVNQHSTENTISVTLKSLEPLDVLVSQFINATNDAISVGEETISGHKEVPLQEEGKSIHLNDSLKTWKDISQTGYNSYEMRTNAALPVDEEESQENMEIWVNKLRQLETPEFLKYQKPRRQPHSTPHFMYTTLPPIKEDQGSPKCDQPNLTLQLQEKEENVVSKLSEKDPPMKTKVTEISEQSEELPKKYLWERSPDKITTRSSPLELMRKHSGEESSRSETYKAFIAQSLSQRQSSIIGSLLSDRLDKKAETSEGKSFSRLESSYLLSSYLKPKKDLQPSITEETVSQNISSTSSTTSQTDGAFLVSDLGANTTIAELGLPEACSASDPLTSLSGENTSSVPFTSELGANIASDPLDLSTALGLSGECKASDSLTSPSGENTTSTFIGSKLGANTASNTLGLSGVSKQSNSLTIPSGEITTSVFIGSELGANTASDPLDLSTANTANQSLTNPLGENTEETSGVSLSSELGANTDDDPLGLSEESKASDSLPSKSEENSTIVFLASELGANTDDDPLGLSEESKASDSLPSKSEENSTSVFLASELGANSANDTSSPTGARTDSDFLTSPSGVNMTCVSLSSALGVSTVSDTLNSTSGSNIAIEVINDAPDTHTDSSVSITNTSDANKDNKTLSSPLGSNVSGESLRENTTSVANASDEKTDSDTLTNASGKSKANTTLSKESGPKTASNSLAITKEETRASTLLISASGSNATSNLLLVTTESGDNSASDAFTNTLETQQEEEKEPTLEAQRNNLPASVSTELPSKLKPPVASPCKVFPDVWHHPEKIRGKLNPRPGKIILFSEPGFRGHRHEIYSDVGNMSDWELQGTVSICIVRGGWLLYEKPQFRGKRVMLTEGETDLSCPWEVEPTSENSTRKPKFWIGSLRHVVWDFKIPRISLFNEENGEGNKITFIGATPDLRVQGHPTKTESIIVHSGMWLVYNKPLFEGDPYILESGGYPNRKAWNGQDSHLCSLQPAQIGGPTVEKPNEPKILLFKYPGFEGPILEVSKDLNSLQGELNNEGECLLTVGSIRVLGGCWVAYEKEGFHGHQYLLEEGKYKDWSTWGGYSDELGSLRHIRTDFSEPEIVLYEEPGCSDGPCLRLNEALSDIEVAQYGTKTESIHVLNGVWVAYENVDFSGEQYILEKGIYHSYQDWGAKDSCICSVQPVLQVGGQSFQYSPKIQLFSEPNFHGDCMTFVEDHSSIPESFSVQSCRVEGGSWSLYGGEDCLGEQYILSEGDYPTRTAMGCQSFGTIRSLKRVPLYFSIPSISLHGLEKFEGKELNFTGEVRSLQGEGYNNHVLSIRVKSGLWVLYEHSDFRGRQWLLECTQIPNWLLYSGLQRIGSLCPIRQKRVYFRLQNRVLGLFLCVPETSEDMKAARVHLCKPQEGSCDLWFYEEGRIKNQMVPHMSLQIVGTANQGTKVVLWSEGRKPVQTWNLEDSGYIVSGLFKGLCLDIKGGNSYDHNHVVVWEVSEDRPTQLWNLDVY